MATTALFTEVLVIGLETLAWVTLLLLSIFETSLPASLKEWEGLTILSVTAAAYVLGIIIDRVADAVFLRLLARPSEKDGLPKVRIMRLRVMQKDDGMAKFIDYQRSRLRIARATVLNVAFMIPSSALFLWTRTEMRGVGIGLIAVAGAVFLMLSLYAAMRIDDAPMSNLIDAYKLIADREGPDGSD